MHEVSVVSDIVSAILRELENYNVEKVEEVVLVVGEMTSLGQEQLEFAYEIVTKDTKLEGSKLVIENEKIRVRCESCGYEGGAQCFHCHYVSGYNSGVTCMHMFNFIQIYPSPTGEWKFPFLFLHFS